MRLNRWIVLLIVFALVLAADQITKALVIATIAPYSSVTTPLSPFLRFTYSENTGSAFGFLPQAGDLFLILAFVIVGALLIFYRRVPPEARLQQIAVGLVTGGAIGNAVDRLQHGAVIDWVHLTIPGLISNVSNLADHAIVVGALTLVALSWIGDVRDQRTITPEKSESPAEESGATMVTAAAVDAAGRPAEDEDARGRMPPTDSSQQGESA
jgi:signal peptidase II